MVQRAPLSQNEADYKKLVKQGKWCRDTEKSGQLHPGQQCYREIPPRPRLPAGDQVCFDKKTGKFVEQPARISSQLFPDRTRTGPAIYRWTSLDLPQPFTHRGRRALGHFVADIATEDPDTDRSTLRTILGSGDGNCVTRSRLPHWEVRPDRYTGMAGREAWRTGPAGVDRLDRKVWLSSRPSVLAPAAM